MERSIRDTALGVLVGAAIAGGLYWVGDAVSLALVAGLCWAVGGKLTLLIGDRFPAYATGESWADKRWTGLSVGLVTLAAFVGVSPYLPISSELRLGLGFLVVGAGLVAYAAGTLAVLERVDGDADAASAPRDSPRATSGD
ncbi:hypothetical protein [Halopiger goleimassiliensis]|uniref:hypothetical protein n=1 Tax=Halopiger goleimassiliensis TaxID=1293048 RepID=UPI000677DC27|nr:hypothetical protein [Halopiger goleimassiliensis]